MTTNNIISVNLINNETLDINFNTETGYNQKISALVTKEGKFIINLYGADVKINPFFGDE